MTSQSMAVTRQHSNAYNIFILVLTIMSLGVMVLLILPLDDATLTVLRVYDNLFCVVFLIDFALNLRGAHPRSAYFIGQRGWIDLLGSIPSFGAFPAAGLFRLFRLFRLARIAKMLRGKRRDELVRDILDNRSSYATFITLLLVFLVLSISSVLMVQFESRSPDANIKTGGDALWWSIVTITTVGYGDYYPVTPLGRMTAVAVMFSGVGIIGALASILASLLVAPKPQEPESAPETTDSVPSPADPVATELAQTRLELAQTRTEMAALRELMTAASVPSPGADAGSGA